MRDKYFKIHWKKRYTHSCGQSFKPDVHLFMDGAEREVLDHLVVARMTSSWKLVKRPRLSFSRKIGKWQWSWPSPLRREAKPLQRIASYVEVVFKELCCPRTSPTLRFSINFLRGSGHQDKLSSHRLIITYVISLC
jgi:hypothetical protein